MIYVIISTFNSLSNASVIKQYNQFQEQIALLLD